MALSSPQLQRFLLNGRYCNFECNKKTTKNTITINGGGGRCCSAIAVDAPSPLTSVSSIRWGSALIQGAREEMEDDLITVHSEDLAGFSYAAVFDGLVVFSCQISEVCLRPVLRRMILAQQSLLFSSEIICCSSLMLVTRVIVNGRICGDIAVSRAFGDMPLKAKKNEMLKKGLDEGRWSQKFISRIHFTKDLVTACPDVSQVALGSDAEYVILASDGLWDYINRTEGLKITSAFLLLIWDG